MNISRRMRTLVSLSFLTTGFLAAQAPVAIAAQSTAAETGALSTAPSAKGRLYVRLNGPVVTGGSFANPNDQIATITYFFTDANGVNTGEGSFTIPANGQIALFFNQPPFVGAPSSGTLTYTSNLPLSVSGIRGFINQVGEFIITTAPASLLTSSVSEPVIIPHWVDGGGWGFLVVIINNTNKTVGGTAQFFLGNGTPATLTVNGNTGTSFPYTIPPRSSIELVSAGTAPNPQVGSVRIVPSASESSQSAFDINSFKSGGVTKGEFTIPGSR